jgi:cyclase
MTDRIRLLERREVDELIILDIAATPNKRSPRFDEVRQLCENLFMPVTIGGGVRNVNDIRRLLEGGADKVAICTAALERPELIDEAAQKFGNQAIVVSIDCRGAHQSGESQRVFARCAKADAGRVPSEWAQEAEARGAGEILLTSIDRDGMMDGYDLDLIREVSNAVSIPVIANGGCGTYEHMKQAFEAGAHAVASGAMLQFCDATPKGAARYLSENGVPVRL